MYLFVYKTTHKNGKFYIGRHGTLLLEDGYLGSGIWVKSIKDKSLLTREILCFASSMEELHSLEEYYIDLHWNDPFCMNFKKTSIGSSTEDVKRRVRNGTHNFLTRNDGSSVTSDRVKDGTNPFLMREDGSSIGRETCQKRLKNGTHPLLMREDGSSLGREVCHQRLKNGTHPFLKFKGSVPCYNKEGEYKRISKEEYESQSGDMKSREFVHTSSKEGKTRREFFSR